MSNQTISEAVKQFEWIPDGYRIVADGGVIGFGSNTQWTESICRLHNDALQKLAAIDAAARVEPTDKDLGSATPTQQGETSEETGVGGFENAWRAYCLALGLNPESDRLANERKGFRSGFNTAWNKRAALTSSVESKPSPAERETKSGASLGAATDKEERFP